MNQLVDSAKHVHGRDGDGEVAVEPEEIRPVVELQVERSLPRTGAAVAPGELAELLQQTAPPPGRRRGEELGHALGNGSRRCVGRVVDEGAIVPCTVAVDIRSHPRRVRGARRQPADGRYLESRPERIAYGGEERVLPLEAAAAPLLDVGIPGGCATAQVAPAPAPTPAPAPPAASRSGTETSPRRRGDLIACAGPGIGRLQHDPAPREAAEPHRQLFRLRTQIGDDLQHLPELRVDTRVVESHGARSGDHTCRIHEDGPVRFVGENEALIRVEVDVVEAVLVYTSGVVAADGEPEQ